MDGRLLAFKAATASDEQLREVYDFLALAAAHDNPEAVTNKPDEERYDAFVASLFRSGSPQSSGRMNLLLVRCGGRIAVSVAYTFGGGEDGGLVPVKITVHPERRRQGIGTAVLRDVVQVFRATGTTRIGATVQSGDFEKWAWNVGFRPVARQAFQHLMVAEVDHARWEEAPVPVGYRLESWHGAAPEDLLGAYARARREFEGLVPRRFAVERTDWTPERIRENEAKSAAENAECRIVVAIHEATGEIVGMTETTVFPAEPESVTQGTTAVVHKHQGNGLGRVMKAEMMRRLLTERPGTVKVATRALGEHMVLVNRRLGYRTVAEYAYVEATLDHLERTSATAS